MDYSETRGALFEAAQKVLEGNKASISDRKKGNVYDVYELDTFKIVDHGLTRAAAERIASKKKTLSFGTSSWVADQRTSLKESMDSKNLKSLKQKELKDIYYQLEDIHGHLMNYQDGYREEAREEIIANLKFALKKAEQLKK